MKKEIRSYIRELRRKDKLDKFEEDYMRMYTILNYISEMCRIEFKGSISSEEAMKHIKRYIDYYEGDEY